MLRNEGRRLQDTLQENPLKHMTTRRRLRPAAQRASPLEQAVTTALDDMKAVNVSVLDVRGLTDIADTMVIASGNSDRHVRSIAERVVEKAKAAGFRPLGTEGARDGGVGAGGSAGCRRARDAAAGTRVLRPGKFVGEHGRRGGSGPAPHRRPPAARRALKPDTDARAPDRGGHAPARLGTRRVRRLHNTATLMPAGRADRDQRRAAQRRHVGARRGDRGTSGCWTRCTGRITS